MEQPDSIGSEHGPRASTGDTVLLNRRDVLKTTGAGILGVSGLTTTVPTADGASGTTTYHRGMDVTLVAADQSAGFNYPYYLYAPVIDTDHDRPILVEPNNTGSSTDDFGQHHSAVRDLITDENHPARIISDTIGAPLLVPVFPRPQSDPVDWRHYVHYLDTDTMEITSGKLARVDKQLLAMVEHARSILTARSYPVTDEIIMNGYSASGNFANRFAALHPDAVSTVTAGGINGTPILPIARDKGHTLNYQIGIANLESLIGEPFDLQNFVDIDQYLYLGSEDTNDTIPFDDAWSDTQRRIALDVYGQDMQDDRMPYSESVYNDVGAAATFKIYDGVGHEYTNQIIQDITDFHRRNLDVSRIEFATPPVVNASTVTVSAAVDPDRSGDTLDLRVLDGNDTTIAHRSGAIAPGDVVEPQLQLSRSLNQGETLTVGIFEPGISDPTQAIVSTQATVIDTARVAFLERPLAGQREVTVAYALDAGYTSDPQPRVALEIGTETTSRGVANVDPGEAAVGRFKASKSLPNVPFQAGKPVKAVLRDVNTGTALASATANATTVSPPTNAASVSFAEQPLHGDREVTIEYSVASSYTVSEAVDLMLAITGSGLRQSALLDGTHAMYLRTLTPGASGQETFRMPNVPLEAADQLDLVTVDEVPIARATTQVGFSASGTGGSGTYPAVGGSDHVVDTAELRQYIQYWVSQAEVTSDGS